MLWKQQHKKNKLASVASLTELGQTTTQVLPTKHASMSQRLRAMNIGLVRLA